MTIFALQVASEFDRRANSLPRHFKEPKPRDFTDLRPRLVFLDVISERTFDIRPVFGILHVDEINHDQTTKIPQTQLTGDFISSFQIGVEGGFLDITAACCTRRVAVRKAPWSS